MPKSQQEILEFLNTKHSPFRTKGKWLNSLKNNKGNQASHWGSLGSFLKTNKIKMLDSNNIIYDFSNDIRDSEEKAKVKDIWKNWLPKELEAYNSLGHSGKKDNDDHVCGIIRSMLDDGYSFKAKESIEKNMFVKKSVLPSCQELTKLAEELKEKRGKEPAPDAIFDLWQALNENQQLDDNVREKLCYKCFTALT